MQDSSLIPSKNNPMPFMDVIVDYAFKRVFGSVQNKKTLIAMLNAFLEEYVGKITDLELLHPEQLGILPKDKKVSYDIYSQEGNECHFLIEMQHGRQTFYSRRAVAYVSRAVSNELQKGDRTYNFPDVISLNFLDYHDPKIMGRQNFIQRMTLKNEENENFSEKIMLFFVDLSNFADGNIEVDFSDERQKWAYYIKNIGHLHEEDVENETGIFREFINQCRMTNLNDTEMREYKKSIMEYADVQDACVAAMEDGFAAGEAKGEARGRTEGKAEGAAEAKRQMVLSMLEKGFDIKLISELTGLSETEVLNISREH